MGEQERDNIQGVGEQGEQEKERFSIWENKGTQEQHRIQSVGEQGNSRTA